MSNVLLAATVLLLVGSNLFWIRRVRTVENGIERARTLDTANGGDVVEERGPIYEAAAAADVQPDALPDEIERLQERTDQLDERVEHVRESMAEACWEAFFEERVDPGPHVVHIEVDGDSDLARELAREALKHDDLIGIVTAREDESFAIGVGESVVDAYPAREIAADLISIVGRGGSSGSDRLASGGGAEPGSLADATEKLSERLRDEI